MHDTFFHREFRDCMHGIFQKIGKDRTESHLRAAECLRSLDLYVKNDLIFHKPCLVNGKNRIQQLISAERVDDSVVILLIDLLNIIKRALRFLFRDKSLDGGKMMAHVVPQDLHAVFAAADLLNLRVQGVQLHIGKLTVLFSAVFQLIFLKIDEQENDIGNTHGKCEKFHDHLISGVEKHGELCGRVIKHIIDKWHCPEDIQLPVRFCKKQCGSLAQIPA